MSKLFFQQQIRDSWDVRAAAFLRYYFVLVFPMGVTPLETKWYRNVLFYNVFLYAVGYITILLHNEIPNLQ